MKIKCDNCQTLYTIRDDQLPGEKVISFPCPSCKSVMTLDGKSKQKLPEYLHKAPSNKKKRLKAAKETSGDKRKILHGEPLKKKILNQTERLAPMPQIVVKAREVIASSRAGFKEIGQLLESDPVIAATVLKMANSAYYLTSGTISSLQEASVILGNEELFNLIMVVSSSRLLGKILPGYRMKSGFLWQHSLAVAVGSKIIGKRESTSLGNEAFSAGLIHDIGMLLLDEEVLAQRETFDVYLGDGKNTYLNGEGHIFGFDHAEIAYDLCKKWNMPEKQAAAIKHHHTPALSQGNKLSYILNIADSIAKISGIGVDIGDIRHEPDEDVMRFLSLPKDDLNPIIEEVTRWVDTVVGGFN